MKYITINRPNEACNKNYPYSIFINGKKQSELRNGERQWITISDETKIKTLEAKLTWCGSKKINLQNVPHNGVININGNNFLNKKKFPSLFILSITPIVILVLDSDHIVRLVISGILLFSFVALCSTLTIFRNRWISIETKEKE